MAFEAIAKWRWCGYAAPSLILDAFALVYQAIEDRLIFLLNSTPLEQLLEVRENLRDLPEENSESIINRVDNSIIELFKQTKFDDLIEIATTRYGHDQLFKQMLKPLLRDNISKIINIFKSSHSFANASSNAALLKEAVDFISPTQWEEILKAFFENSQIYNSHGCANTFESLFNKSIELNASLKTSWLSFKEKLDSLGTHDRYINSLKKVIDSQLRAE